MLNPIVGMIATLVYMISQSYDLVDLSSYIPENNNNNNFRHDHRKIIDKKLRYEQFLLDNKIR